MQIRYLNREVGTLRLDKVFVTHREDKHIFRMYNGIAISVGVIQKIYRAGCRKIIILMHLDNGKTEKYVTTPMKFLDEGMFYRDGFDSQKVLSFKKMEQKKLTECR